MKSVLAISGVFVSSLALTGLNKILFGSLAVPFPLLVTFIHFSVTSIWLTYIQRFSSTAKRNWRVVLPIACFTVLDVGLTNMAFSRVSLPVITVVKSANLVTTYLVGVFVGLERFSARLLSVCLLIAAGVICSLPTGQVNDSLGLLFLMVAVLSMSFRWVLIQKLATHLEPLDLLNSTMPVSALGFLLLSVCFEHDKVVPWLAGLSGFAVLLPLFIVAVSCLCAFTLIYFEFLTVKLTSSLTLIISGSCKEVSVLMLSALAFGEYLTAFQWVSIGVSLYGIYLYWCIRTRSATPSYRTTTQAIAVTGTGLTPDSQSSSSDDT